MSVQCWSRIAIFNEVSYLALGAHTPTVHYAAISRFASLHRRMSGLLNEISWNLW